MSEPESTSFGEKIPQWLQPQERLPLLRPFKGRIVGGVCLGLAAHLNVNVKTVRLSMVLLGCIGGIGVFLYFALWLALPPGDPGDLADRLRSAKDARLAATLAVKDDNAGNKRVAKDLPVREIMVGILLITIALGLLATRFGMQIEWSWLLPIVIVLTGLILAWSQLDDAHRGRWLSLASGRTPLSVLRIAAGIALAIFGELLLLSQGMPADVVFPALTAAFTMILGIGLILAPWLLRLNRELGVERTARERANERADIAAHLHDSVLQTLTLIQNNAHNPNQVVRLARGQERDLRQWLYSDRKDSGESVSEEMKQLVAQLEDDLAAHNLSAETISIDLVTVGDCVRTANTHALIEASSEAIKNAVRHGKMPVSVFLEIRDGVAEVTVRDRGDGFDLNNIPGDRFGVKESIQGRVQRKGGKVAIRSEANYGTQVQLQIPVKPINPTSEDKP